MKIFIHGNGDYANEVKNFLLYSEYYKKFYKYELRINKKNINPKKIKCVGFSHTDTLDDLKINKIKKYYHLICSSKKQDVFEKFIKDNKLQIVNYLLIDSPLIKKENKVGNGIVAFHTYFAYHIEIGNYCYFGPTNVISNRVSIGNGCFLFQRNTISKNCQIGDNTIITTNVIINDGIRIGKNCYIAPNQIITKDLEDNCMLINNKIIRNFNES